MKTRTGIRWSWLHPAWLLVLVPPLLQLVWVVAMGGEASVGTSVGDLALRVGLLVVPVSLAVGTGLTGRSGWGLRLRKELRQQVRGGVLALLVPGLLMMLGEAELIPWAVGGYCLGCLLLGADAFGAEFEHRTLGNLLVQPVSRGRVFVEKVGLVALLVGVATANLWLVLFPQFRVYPFNQGDLLEVAVVGVAAVFTGPLFSLLSRSALAGLVFVAAVPLTVMLVVMVVVQAWQRWADAGTYVPDAWLNWIFGLLGPVYLVGCLAWSWRLFRRYEWKEGAGRGAPVLHPLGGPADRLAGWVLPRRGLLAVLLRKELRLHVVPWLVAGVLVGVFLLSWGLRLWGGQGGSDLILLLTEPWVCLLFAGLSGVLVLVTAGAATIAEERASGMLEWQLTQPIPLRSQWWAKLGTSVVLGFGLGCVLPAVLVWLAFGGAGLGKMLGDEPAFVAVGVLGLCWVTFAGSVYASSISGSTMKSVAAAVFIVGTVLGLVVVLGSAVVGWFYQPELELDLEGAVRMREITLGESFWAPTPGVMLARARMAVGVVAGLVTVAFLFLARLNLPRPRVSAGSVVRQLAWVAAGVILSVVVVMGSGTRMVVQMRIGMLQEAVRQEKDMLVQALLVAQRRGGFTREVAAEFGVGVEDAAEAVVETVLRERGVQGLRLLGRRLAAPAEGMPVRGSGADGGHGADAADGARGMRMDPELMRRYGLQPAPR